MKKFLIPLAVGAVALSTFADEPTATLTSFVQDAASRRVTIEYTLENGPAVVTLELMTNGVPIPASGFVCPTTDSLKVPVNAKVGSGSYKIYWQADRDAPGFAAAAGKFSVRLQTWKLDNPPLYMGIDLTTKSNVTYYASRESVEGGEQALRWKTDWMLFRRVPAKGAEWLMSAGGNNTRESGTKHYVKFSHDYYAAIYETSQKQFANILANTGVSGITIGTSGYVGEDKDLHPAEGMSIAALRGMVADDIDWPNTGHVVRNPPKSILGCLRDFSGVDVDLPTEAEWEYACRAGTATKFCCGNTFDNAYGWTTANCTSTMVIGTTTPNAWGLYDFHGNVYEPCLDWPSPDYAEEDDNVDPEGPKGACTETGYTGERRCLRGGAWNGGPGITASYYRGHVLSANGQKNQGVRFFAPAEVK